MIKKVTVTTALMAVGVITSLGFSAVAQTTRPTPSADQSMPQSGQPMMSPDRMVPLPNRPSAPGTSQLSALDQQFVMDAAQGGMAEVELGQLALQKSKNPEVQRFARQMIQQHSQANEQLMRIATAKGVTPPPTAGPKYEAARMQLMQLSGASFDRAYMNEGGVNSHLEAAAVYQRETQSGQDPELKAFARQLLPAVQQHLEMAAAMTGYRLAQSNSMPSMNMRQNNAMPQMNMQNNAMPGMNMQNNAMPGSSDMPMNK